MVTVVDNTLFTKNLTMREHLEPVKRTLPEQGLRA